MFVQARIKENAGKKTGKKTATTSSKPYQGFIININTEVGYRAKKCKLRHKLFQVIVMKVLDQVWRLNM
jgi:hypothetical protein